MADNVFPIVRFPPAAKHNNRGNPLCDRGNKLVVVAHCDHGIRREMSRAEFKDNISEIVVRDTIHAGKLKNTTAFANAECFGFYANWAIHNSIDEAF